jgi:hypothetical protein
MHVVSPIAPVALAIRDDNAMSSRGARGVRYVHVYAHGVCDVM